MKKKYDSTIVFLYATGNERLLPQEFRRSIPYSTIATWRKIDCSKYIGHEFRYFFDEAFNHAHLREKYKRLRTAMFGIGRSWVSLSTIFQTLIDKASTDKGIRKSVIDAIGYIRNYLGIERALKLFGITKAKYYEWVLEARFECFDSFTSLCIKRHPTQLNKKEIEKIRCLLSDDGYEHWPVASIAAYSLRENLIIASLYSWYKYGRGVRNKVIKKRQKKVGIVSSFPNEYWHVDTTYVSLFDGTKACVAVVMDNYSKMILGYDVAYNRSFKNVKKALVQAIDVAALLPDERNCTVVADGGSENNNKEVDKLIANSLKGRLRKVRALKEIRHSNSPVEAIHKTVKSRYLRDRKFSSVKELENFLKWVVVDYNEIRPHYKHRPRTPKEVYFNIPLRFNLPERMKAAKAKRIALNKAGKCIQCGKKNDSCASCS